MKNWKIWILLAAAMVVAASCWKDDKHRNKYNFTLDCNFEYNDVTFGDDSVFVVSDIYAGGMVHFSAKMDGEDFVSGFCIAGGVDPILSDHEAKTTFHTVSHQFLSGEDAFTVFREGPSMPEKHIDVLLPNDDCFLEPQSVLLNNTHRVVRAAKFGTGLAGGAFGAEDWASVTFTGYLKGTKTGEATLRLIDGSKEEKPIVSEWTELKLTDLGRIDEIKVSLASSREDLVKDVCIDHLLCSCYVEY